jgi:inner membrane protein
MLWIGLLVLLLLIPLVMVRSALSERLTRRSEAVANITAGWARAQTVSGPVLSVPYRIHLPPARPGDPASPPQTVTGYASFLPESLEIRSALEPSVLHRGIYRAVVYRADLEIEAQFAPVRFDEWKTDPADVLWEDAFISLGVTDLRGIRETVRLSWEQQPVTMQPGTRMEGLAAGLHARLTNGVLTGTTTTGATCRVRLGLNGSPGIRFVPMGRQTRVTVKCAWPDPSFAGGFLPVERSVTSRGFEASWQVAGYARSWPQQWRSPDTPKPLTAAEVASAGFGVDLIEPLDAYRYVERSVKYGVLFIVLVFTAFFLFEILAPLKVHPFQYLLVGLALVLFYLALLALSEFIAFGAAYLLGSAASTVLVTLYGLAALQRAARALVVAAELGVTYGFLYVVLRLQDYALLVGTAGLMLALGLVMYLTRNIDWYARDAGS